jgi:hypothetical protein
VRELREAGLRPGDVIGRAAAAVALLARPEAVSASDVASLIRHALERPEDWAVERNGDDD